MKLHVSVVKVGQTQEVVDQVDLDLIAGEECRSSGPIVSAFSGVFMKSATELADPDCENSVAGTTSTPTTWHGLNASQSAS